MNDPDTLRTWLDRAWDEHPHRAEALRDELVARAPALPDDADGAEAVRLAEHVLLGHCADAAALQRFLQALPQAAALDAGRQRAAWALATFEDGAAAPLADAERWRALQNVVLAELVAGRVERARERLFAERAAAAASTDEAARRAFASTCNNVALDLRTGPRAADRDALMIDVAQLSRRAWEAAGTWQHVERADYQLAMCHALLGHGEEATAHARACVQRCEAEGADAAERFFAHECSVHAARAAGDDGAAALERARMAALLAQITDPGLREWCAKTLEAT